MNENIKFEPYLEYALSALDTLCKAAEMKLTNRDGAILSLDAGSAEQHSERVSEVYEAIYQGFFNCASKGVIVHPKMGISRREVSAIYPSGNKVFHNFARTYLSLAKLNHELSESQIQLSGAFQLLKKLEDTIGPVFFPPIKPRGRERDRIEQLQKELIFKSGMTTNIRELIESNPLIHSKKSSSRYLLWGSLVIASIVVIVELFWLGRSSLAWVVILLAIAIGLQAIHLLTKGK